MCEFLVRPCIDSEELAERRRRELGMPRETAAALGRSAVLATREGFYATDGGARVEIRPWVEEARAARLSIPPGASLPAAGPRRFAETRVGVANETTMGAARRLVAGGQHAVLLNFANGVIPGGGFLGGARAQEEVLCRSSALYVTLEGDPMYEAHRRQGDDASSDWVILSSDVPFFRTDDGTTLDAPWRASVLTCAAPIATRVGQPLSGDLLGARIRRVLAAAEAYGYEALVLGAWGCGAFGNDPLRTARDFGEALSGPFRGAFGELVFAITDWSPERRFLGPFRDVVAGLS